MTAAPPNWLRTWATGLATKHPRVAERAPALRAWLADVRREYGRPGTDVAEVFDMLDSLLAVPNRDAQRHVSEIKAAYRRGFNDAVAATVAKIEAHMAAHRDLVEPLRKARPGVAATTDTWMNDYGAMVTKIGRLKP